MHGEDTMLDRHLVGASTMALAAALLINLGPASAHDDGKYPNLKGQWERFIVRGLVGQPGFDQTKGWGLFQQAPLIPEYQKILEDSIADQEAGGHGNNVEHTKCVAAGMPWMMVAFRPLEFVVTPDVTYILIADYDPLRRIFTDGRDWPVKHLETFSGYSIGKWIDEDGDGKYDVLEVETRNFKGPRFYDPTGLPLHRDNQSVIRERIYLDKNDPNILHDEITVIDNALTQPWTSDRKYLRNADPLAEWFESICIEYNAQVFVGKENYYLSGDGLLMPTKKGQEPPDLRYFNLPQK
jgi:hypothetical protein